MRRSGELRNEAEVQSQRGRFVLGAEFTREGLLPEALAQVFKNRYRTKSEITSALESFRYVERDHERASLVAEVIERVLQYVPDVDTTNLGRIHATASLIGMTPSRLAEFRATWMLYDNEDQFNEILQGAILGALLRDTKELGRAIKKRNGFRHSLYRRLKTLAVPARPMIARADLSPRQIQMGEGAFYDDHDLIRYLTHSSSAARRFFLLDQLPYLTAAQIETALFARSQWWLKDSLVATLNKELVWREELGRRARAYAEVSRELAQLSARLVRLSASAHAFARREIESELQAIRNQTDGPTAARLVTRLFERFDTMGTSFEFVQTLISAVDALGAKLKGKTESILEVGRASVVTANRVGLDTISRSKVLQILTRLGEGLSGPLLIQFREQLEELKEWPARILAMARLEVQREIERSRIATAKTLGELERWLLRGS